MTNLKSISKLIVSATFISVLASACGGGVSSTTESSEPSSSGSSNTQSSNASKARALEEAKDVLRQPTGCDNFGRDELGFNPNCP